MSESTEYALSHDAGDQHTDEAAEELRRLILFQACDEWFALGIEWVREIQPLERVTRVPNAPPDVLGVLNLRGRILTLYDLAVCMGVPAGTHPPHHVIVLDIPEPELHVGLAAQQIAQVQALPVSAIALGGREGSLSALEGIFEVGGRVVGLLDLARVFARNLPEWGVTLEARDRG